MEFENVYNGRISWDRIDQNELSMELESYYSTILVEIEDERIPESLDRIDYLLSRVQAAFLFAQHLGEVLGYNELFSLASQRAGELKVCMSERFDPFLQNLDTSPLPEEDASFYKFAVRTLRMPERETSEALSRLKNQFFGQVMQDLDARQLELEASEYSLDGVNEDVRSLICRGDKIVLNSSQHVVRDVMGFCVDERLRREYWSFLQERCGANEVNVKEEIQIKRKASVEMGYSSVLECKLDGRMLENRAQLEVFYEEIYVGCRQRFLTDISLLRASGSLPWNISFEIEHLRAENTVNIREFDKYFPSRKVARRFLDFFQNRLDIRFQESPDSAWDSQVETFDVYHNEIWSARLHFDLLQRKGKAPGGWVQIIAPRIFSIEANFAPNAQFFTYEQALTLIHELGHALHCIYAQGKYRSQGSLDVPWDFVEVPSQLCECFLENWPFVAELAQTSGGTPITADEFEQLRACNHFGSSFFIMRQISLGITDIALHEDYNGEDLDSYIWERTSKYQVTTQFPHKSIVRHFMHLFGNSHDYTCGYYSYMWADCLRVNVYKRFKKDADLQRFVDVVLRPGAAVAPARLLALYGAFSSTDKYLLYYGIPESGS